MARQKYYICVTPFFPEPDSFRGSYVLDQVRAIERNSDYQVIVMKPCLAWAMKDDYEYEDINVYRFKDYTVPSNMWPNRFCDWLTSRALLSKYNSIGLDIKDIAVAHAHVTKQGAYVNYLKKLNPQIKSIVQHHGFDVMSISDGRLRKYKFHECQCVSHGVAICNEADLNIGVSQKTLDYVLEQPGIHLKNQYVLYNGVDTNLFYPTESKENSSIFTIGCIANFWPLKDQITLIKAVELLVKSGSNNIKCIFVGSGATLDDCKQYVADNLLDNYFSFQMEVQHSELPDFYRNLDLFVLPSYWEAFGCVYTEAYACGVPFIGVKGQGIAEIIFENDDSKWLIEKGDVECLSKLIDAVNRKINKNMVLKSPWKIDELVCDYLYYLECFV